MEGVRSFFASMCNLMGKGKVISIDIGIPDEVRRGVEDHPLGKFVTLIESDSVAPEVIERIKSAIKPNDRVFIFKDSFSRGAK